MLMMKIGVILISVIIHHVIPLSMVLIGGTLLSIVLKGIIKIIL